MSVCATCGELDGHDSACPYHDDDVIESLRQQLAALKEQNALLTVQVPDGWKLVPVEPTQTMCQAGQDKALEWPKFPLRINPIYQAMLSAAPTAKNQSNDVPERLWQSLFWDLAIELKCLPSSFVDANEHVFNKARKLIALSGGSGISFSSKKPTIFYDREATKEDLLEAEIDLWPCPKDNPTIIAELESEDYHARMAQQAADGWIADPDTIPQELIKTTRDAICKEFGINGTDGYYKRILAKVFGAFLTAHPQQVKSEDAQPPVIYYMRDNHTFKRLSLNVEAAIDEIRAEFADGWTSGMLCSQSPGMPKPVHARGKANLEYFDKEVRDWYAAISAQEPKVDS